MAIALVMFALGFVVCGFGAGDEEQEERWAKATRGVGVECRGQESCAGVSELGNKS